MTHAPPRPDGCATIIADQLEQFLLDSTARQAAPLVARLHERAEQIRSTEVQRYSSRLGELGEAHHDAVEALTKSIVAKLLHAAVGAAASRCGHATGRTKRRGRERPLRPRLTLTGGRGGTAAAGDPG